jgi:DNA-binding XRE family transcriptional regulator
LATLKELRERALMTPDELAAKVGVTRQAIYLWERGEARPTIKHIRTLVEVLSKTPDEIFAAIEESKKELAAVSGC